MMNELNNQDFSHKPAKRLDAGRAEMLALGGLGLQGMCTLVCLLFSWLTQSAAYGLLRWQAALGILVWFLTWIQLRLRRLARDERLDLEEAERRRRAQGMQALFQNAEEGLAARNLRHMETILAPIASVLLALGLLAPFGLFLLRGAPWSLAATNLRSDFLLPAIVGGLFVAFSLFLLGMYAAGMARESAWRLLRAGAGYSLTTAFAGLITGLAFTLITQGWLATTPDTVVCAVVMAWMTLHAIEILINFVLDFYRPRVAGTENRPGYDSRLSGLFAEPQGIFHTFAHTLDYQFGFKVSDTWFFRFLEKAFMPLVLIQLTLFYLLSCFVVVRPGEAALIERWGAPLGVRTLPENDGDWDKLPTPLKAGLHIKLPWPIETARIMNQEKISNMTIGYHVENEADAKAKEEKLRTTVVTWDTVHVKDENQYLMPLPAAQSKEGSDSQVDALLLSGEFRIEYRIGNDTGDVYRYCYRFQNPEETIKTIFQREVTAFLAGADFWDILAQKPEETRNALQARLSKSLHDSGLGIELLFLGISNLHPPAGDVGKSYQEVIASGQQKETEIHTGWIDANEIVGLAPSEADKIRKAAEADSFGVTVMAEKQADWFRSHEKALAAAPSSHLLRLRMRMLEEALMNARKIMAPRDTLVIMDDTKTVSPMNIEKAIVREATK